MNSKLSILCVFSCKLAVLLVCSLLWCGSYVSTILQGVGQRLAVNAGLLAVGQIRVNQGADHAGMDLRNSDI